MATVGRSDDLNGADIDVPWLIHGGSLRVGSAVPGDHPLLPARNRYAVRDLDAIADSSRADGHE